MLWNRKYQEFDLVVSSVTTKVKGVAQAPLHEVGNMVWDEVDYSGPWKVGTWSSGCWAVKVFLWLLKIKIPLFIYLKIFVGEEHLLCGDQRHCDKESEAGEMCAGAFPSFIFFYYYLCSSCFNDITYCIANKDYSK